MDPNRLFLTLLLFLASTVFMADKQTYAQTEDVLFSFSSTATGLNPNAGVTFDTGGNLYGTTLQGGAYGYGTVFRLIPSISGWTEQVIHSFNNNGVDGVSPYSGLIFDAQGNLYGTTYYGGVGTCTTGQYPGCGTVFKISAKGRYQIIHSFRAGSDGAFPASSLVRDSKGNLFGTTSSGGRGVGCDVGGYVGCGAVFGMQQINGVWHEKVLYAFTGMGDGEYLYGPVTIDNSEHIYGTAEEGGNSCAGGFTCGVVFEISHTQSGWLEKTLYSFNGGNDGQWPVGNLVLDGIGNLYGATLEGGNATNCFYGCGTVFELSPGSNSWSERVLYRFSGPVDGLFPYAGVIVDGAGNIYGTTGSGGIGGGGSVFKLDTANTETTLHSFTGPPDGSAPYSTLVFDAAGNLYGTTSLGGSVNSGGIVFEIGP